MSSLKKTLVLKIDSKNPDRYLMAFGARAIKDGRLVAFPTETVYGIAANLLDGEAIKRLYNVKRRPKAKPFTVHISSLNMIKNMGCKLSREAKALVDRFWPGPLTIILNSKDGKKVGFRMPDNRVALELIKRAKVPVVAPSANLSGRRPPESARDVLKQLNGKIDMVLDAGRCKIGVESTVVDLTARPFKILREGAIKKKKILEIVKDA